MKNNFVFLDRDGVICKEGEYIHKKEDVELIENSAEAIKLLNQNNFKVIIITNQSAIARGLCTISELNEIHEHLKLLLKEKGAKIDKVYYCPHHPTKGQIKKYVKTCKCRKPSPGLIYEAQKNYNINLKNSYMIGDKTVDIKAGLLAGCKTILVSTGYGGSDNTVKAVPHHKQKDLFSAVTNVILKNP